MMIIGSFVLGILFTVVIPTVTKIFEDTKATLPWMTRFLIGLHRVRHPVTGGCSSPSSWAGRSGGSCAGAGRRRGAPAGTASSCTVPIFGRLARIIAIGRFARTLSTLLKSGVPLLVAMDIVKNVVGNVRLAEVIEQARDAIREGESIAAPLKRSGEFPPLVHHMVAIGERSGALEEMLSNVASAYEEQVDTTVAALTSLLEPIMIVAMGAVVAFIVFSVLMPILQLNTIAGG